MPDGKHVPVDPNDGGPGNDSGGCIGGGIGGSNKLAVYHPPPRSFPQTTHC